MRWRHFQSEGSLVRSSTYLRAARDVVAVDRLRLGKFKFVVSPRTSGCLEEGTCRL
jgi:hypothetical protein